MKSGGHRKNRYLSHYQGTTLEDLVDIQQGHVSDGGKVVDLTCEIELARGLCGNATQILGRLVDGFVDKKDGEVASVSPKTMHSAVQYTQSTLMRVSALVEKQAKINALQNGSFDENFLQLMISRLTSSLQKRLLPADKELFETCCADMAEIATSAASEAGNAPPIQVNIS